MISLSFSLDIPVTIVNGCGCVRARLGEFVGEKHALIVTGRRGAAACGALGDVTDVLSSVGAAYTVFDKAAENPPLSMAYEGGQLAASIGADLVIGIGGGSAMDAAKAIAAFAANPGIEAMELYDAAKLTHASLPLILIPTTSGTGSEANPYSVLTLPDGVHKKTFTSRASWARAALVDPEYTASLPRETTISTALDAFAHAMESYLSPKSDDTSRLLAVYAARGIWDVLTEFPFEFTAAHRAVLCSASCAAGAAISITGTGFPHPLGYSLTLLYGIPHGRACAAFHGDYIGYNMRTPEGERLMNEFASAIGARVSLMKEYLPALAAVDLSLTDEEITRCVDLIKGAKNYKNSPYVLNEAEMLEIYKAHFGGKKNA